MDAFSRVSMFCQYQGSTNTKSCHLVDSFADTSFAGEFPICAGKRVGRGLRIATDPCRGSCSCIVKIDGDNGFSFTPAFREASKCGSCDLNSSLSMRDGFQRKWKNSAWTVEPSQFRRIDTSVREFLGLKVELPWCALLKCDFLASSPQKIRQNVCINLAAIQPGTEPATSVDDREDEPKWRQLKDNNASRRNVGGKWSIESDEELLRLIQESGDSYPMVRTYKNDLCTLEICGCALRSQVLAAMASDQSFTAATNILMGRGLTVLQTVLPGSSGDHSTVSTKLFAPSLLLVEKARRFSPPDGVTGREFMRRLFEAVQMQKLSKFYVEFHAPGTVRDMSALGQEDIVRTTFSFEASDKGVLEQLGKAVALYAIGSIKEKHGNSDYAGFFGKFRRKSEWIPSPQAPVRIRTLSVKEVQSHTNMLFESIHLSEHVPTDKRADRSWLPIPASLMVMISGYSDTAIEQLIQEHVPIHQVQLDLSIQDLKGTGRYTGSRQTEVLLTHAQLVDFAVVLDQYFEDRFTLSDKNLQTGAVIDFRTVPRSKTAKFLETAAISSFVVGAGLFAWLVAARIRGPSGILNDKVASKSVAAICPALAKESLQTALKNEPILPVNEQIPVKELDALCKLAVGKVAKAFDWNVPIQSSVGKGAWIGDHNAQTNAVQKLIQADSSREESSVNVAENETTAPETRIDGLFSSDCEENESYEAAVENQKMQLPMVQETKGPFLYQAVFSRDGNVLGFQPLNREAVSLWASMPFAKLLHKGQKLGPGFWEPQLKYNKPPKNAVVLELCILIDPVSPFVSARPFPM